jgi:DNA gyrase/topoisomerase IV subunit A
MPGKLGDARRSPLVQRDAAQALSETELVASEPVTVVLSSKGWVRSAKGHEVDAAALSYREGDALLAFARGRSNQQAAFLDSSGRAYSTTAHTLPSARGNGEPLTGRFSPPAGAAFVGVAIAENDTRFLLVDQLRLRLRHPLREFPRPQQGRQTTAQSGQGRRRARAGDRDRRRHRSRSRDHFRRASARLRR